MTKIESCCIIAVFLHFSHLMVSFLAAVNLSFPAKWLGIGG